MNNTIFGKIGQLWDFKSIKKAAEYLDFSGFMMI